MAWIHTSGSSVGVAGVSAVGLAALSPPGLSSFSSLAWAFFVVDQAQESEKESYKVS